MAETEQVTIGKRITASDGSTQADTSGRLESLPFGCHEPGCLQTYSSMDLWAEHIKQHYSNKKTIEESCSNIAQKEYYSETPAGSTPPLDHMSKAANKTSDTISGTCIRNLRSRKILATSNSTSVSIQRPGTKKAPAPKPATFVKKTDSQLKSAPAPNIRTFCNPKSRISKHDLRMKRIYSTLNDPRHGDHTYVNVQPGRSCSKTGCDKVFKSTKEKRSHITKCHANQKRDLMKSDCEKTTTQGVVCTLCKAGFSSNEDLDAHKVSQHSKSLCITCSVCQAQFSSKEDLNTHISSQHNYELIEASDKQDTDPIVTAEPAGSTSSSSTDKTKVTPSNNKIKRRIRKPRANDGKSKNIHVYTAQPQKDFDAKLRCASCCKEFRHRFMSNKLPRQGKFAEETKIGLHIKCTGCKQITYSKYEKVDAKLDDSFSNLSEATLACNDPDCMISKKLNTRRNTFSNSAQLWLHFRRYHNEYDEPQTCHICGVQYPSSVKLYKHIHFAHKFPERRNVKRSRKCPDCGVMFSSRATSTLCAHSGKFHRIVHSRLNKCLKCDLKFTNNQELRDHNEEFHCGHRGTYWCDICEKHLIGGKPHKKIHMNTHNPDRPKLECNECGRIYSSKSAVQTHMRLQHPDDTVVNVKCDKCYKIFPNQKSMDRHIKKHANEVKCKVCSKPYLTKTGLKAHMKTRHPNYCELQKTLKDQYGQVEGVQQVVYEDCGIFYVPNEASKE